MKKILAIVLVLGIGFSGLFSLNAEARARRRCHYVSSHSRRITKIKNGAKSTRRVRVKGHVSH